MPCALLIFATATSFTRSSPASSHISLQPHRRGSVCPGLGAALLPRGACSMTDVEAKPSMTDAAAARSLLLLLANRCAAEEAKEAALWDFMSVPPEQRDRVLDEAVSLIASSSDSLLASRCWPLPLPSRRAALGSYARLLDSMMREEPGGGARFTDGGDSAKRRRFVGVLLRQLRRGKGGVWALEREAARRRRQVKTPPHHRIPCHAPFSLPLSPDWCRVLAPPPPHPQSRRRRWRKCCDARPTSWRLQRTPSSPPTGRAGGRCAGGLSACCHNAMPHNASRHSQQRARTDGHDCFVECRR